MKLYRQLCRMFVSTNCTICLMYTPSIIAYYYSRRAVNSFLATTYYRQYKDSTKTVIY
jgi:hypothetical protein